MGGAGSSRWRNYEKKDIVEYSLTLSIDALVKAGLDPLSKSSGKIALEFENGDGIATLEYRMQPPFLKLGYCLAEDYQSAKIRLQKTAPHFGGVRWWFTCPQRKEGMLCGRRVGKLHLPYGSVEFGCRECHGLTYRSAQTHDNRVKHYRKHPAELRKIINSAFDPSASSRRMLAFKALTRGIDESISESSRFEILAAQLINAAALPQLMKASIEAAQEPGRAGFKDRELQLMMAGLLTYKKRVRVRIDKGW